MADDTDRINDELRQQAHARDIRERREQQEKGPEKQEKQDEAKQVARLDAMIASRVDRALRSAFQQLKIQSGNSIRVSGGGANWTISWEPPSVPNPQTVTPEGEWYEVTDCNGNTFEVKIRNFVAA